jgi:inhibitor of cysteine peptidase
MAVVTLTDQDNGLRLPLHVGDMLEIHLAEIATAGYRWAPDNYDTGVLELAEATASYPSAAVGSGGEAIFRFRVVGVGSSTLVMKYWRHWEGSGSIIQRFAVTIDASP